MSVVLELGRSALAAAIVTPMRRRHLRGVLAIEQAVYPRPWSGGLFASELVQRETRRYFVALAPRTPCPTESAQVQWVLPGLRRRGRTVVGYAGVMVHAGEAHITTVAVHPAHHRRKVASRLLVAVLHEAVAMGADSATLEVRLANRGAQRLYANFGFVPAGVRPGYYAETGEDALIMWAHDLQGGEFGERLALERRRLDEPGGASGAPDLHVPWVQGRVGLTPDGQMPGLVEPERGGGD